MIRFSREYSAAIDDKNRVVLPSALKKLMGDQAEKPITLEKDIYSQCLNIYPEEYWNEKVQLFESKLNPFDEQDIELLEQFYENFTTVKMAEHGRINIPDNFLNYAEIKKDVVFIGMGKMIRLWDAGKYQVRKDTRKPLLDMYKDKLGNKPGTE
jgi:MraZ protein